MNKAVAILLGLILLFGSMHICSTRDETKSFDEIEKMDSTPKNWHTYEVGCDQITVATSTQPNQVSADTMEAQAKRWGNVSTRVCDTGNWLYITIDDGPNSTYTPQMLEVLKKHDVPATFFMVGKYVKLKDNLVRQVHNAGHSIGSHSYTHRRIKDETHQWKDEYNTGRDALENLGITTCGYRPPWGHMHYSWYHYFDNKWESVWLWSIDTEDWRFAKDPNGADSIYHRIVDHAHPGGIILMHDGGGNRSKTIEALDRAIPDLKKRGWKFGKL